jgi:hypothetical protein
MADTARKLPAISVQLIDNRKCYLVAIREHVEAHAPRDISITDREATAMWLGYYNEMLWGKAIKVVENGVLNQLGLDAVRAHLDQLEASPQ